MSLTETQEARELMGPEVDDDGFSSENIWACGVDSDRVRSKVTEDGTALLKIEHGGDQDSRERDLERAQRDIDHLDDEWVVCEVLEGATVYKLA